jgi:hypothetical protein
MGFNNPELRFLTVGSYQLPKTASMSVYQAGEQR